MLKVKNHPFQVDVAKRKQLQEAKQEAWEREIKMQTQPLKMISLGCVWEGETTAIAAKQLEKLLSFKVTLNTYSVLEFQKIHIRQLGRNNQPE